MVKDKVQVLDEIVTKFGLLKEIAPKEYAEVVNILFNKEIEWRKNEDAADHQFLYKQVVNDLVWKIRINDFPTEPLYTLFIGDKAILTFDDMPDTWSYK